ncbi:minor tail protein [Stenotrophomonas phage Silvanus]|nr:minor tail protein [Stenotrophomonas phage Silvanus]
MPYSDDFDCADFAVHFVREFFGWPVRLPTERPRGDHCEEELADLSKPYGIRTDSPSDGDFVLMFDAGDTIPTHGGVYVVVDGEPSIFHNAKKAGGSVLHPIRKLPRLGLRIEGYYKWVY